MRQKYQSLYYKQNLCDIVEENVIKRKANNFDYY